MGLLKGAKTFLTPKLPKLSGGQLWDQNKWEIVHELVAMYLSQKFSVYTTEV
jgi:hypothetical protein